MLWRQPKSVVYLVVDHVAVTRHRRQPLANVALLQSRSLRKVCGGNRAEFGQRLEQPEAIGDRAERSHLLGCEVAEDFAGLPDKPRTRKRRALKVDLRTLDTARKLQENPLMGEFRLHTKLKREFGIELSPRTCGRILAHNRALYGLPGPEKQPRTPKKMPFAARYRHQYWTVDLRYIDMHQIDADPIYCISILENYSRAILANALSRRQDFSAFLAVFYAALSRLLPEGDVVDAGGVQGWFTENAEP